MGVVSTDPFLFLVDDARQAFRDFGCLSGDEPQHGLLIVDADRTIRWRYQGEVPFGDSDEVFKQLNQLASVERRPAP